MLVHTATLKAIVEGQKQFQVPIWQRQYTWRNAQHEQLWSDLTEQYRYLKSGNAPASGHFLGSFVLSPKDPSASGVSYFLVIDGQQRLTSIFRVVFCSRLKNKTTFDPDLLVALSSGDEWVESPFHLRSRSLHTR